MDNITHTLAGLMIGEAALSLRHARVQSTSTKLRLATLISAVIASNLPDVDLLWTTIEAGKLAYLLHHRGHTHTLLMSLPMALLMILPLIRWPARDLLWLFGLNLLALWGHIGLDFGNSYGVHPFWPFDNRWYYGDYVFIVEPWLWLSLLMPLLLRTKGWSSRSAFIILASAMLALCWLSAYVPHGAALVITLWACAYALALKFLSREQQLWVGFAHTLSLLLIWFSAATAIQHIVRAELKAAEPDLQVHDVVLTPMPANPLCWSVIAVSTSTDELALLSGVYALWPVLAPIPLCERNLQTRTTAPLRPPPARGKTNLAATPRSGLVWNHSFSSKKSAFSALIRSNCRAKAFVRFARAPFWTTVGSTMVMGDLRYDREPQLGFAEIDLAPSTACATHLPPWQTKIGSVLDPES